MGNDIDFINWKERSLVAPISKVCAENKSKQYANPNEQKKQHYDPKTGKLDVLF